jgi:hypothetical protein
MLHEVHKETEDSPREKLFCLTLRFILGVQEHKFYEQDSELRIETKASN